MSVLFLRNRHLLLLTLLAVIVAGLSAATTLPRQEDPRLSNWFGFVEVPFPGASAERVEALITEPLENRLREVSEIRQLDARSLTGLAFLMVEIDETVLDTDRVWTRVRDKLADLEPDLPVGAGPAELDHESTETAYSHVTAFEWKGTSPPQLALLKRWADELADRLRNVTGTDLVRVYGAPEEEMTVTVDPHELASLGLSVHALAAQISRADSKVSAGILRGSRHEALIEVAGELTSDERIAAIPLEIDGRSLGLRVGDVATVQRGIRTPELEVGYSNGTRGIFVAARMDEDRRIDRWSHEVRAEVAALRAEVGGSFHVREIFDQSLYTDARLSALLQNLLLGAGLVVVFLFLLMGWRSALLVATALPLTTALVLFALKLLGVPLHQMSVTGMIIALGLLIDNAIVMVDEVRGRLARGEGNAAQALQEAVGHLFVPLLGSTLTTVLAFMPILLLEGAVGQFVGAIAISVVLAITASFLLSMTLLPALTVLLGRGSARTRSWWNDGLQLGWISRSFEAALRHGVARPWLGIAAAALLPIVGLAQIGEHRNQFFPAADRDQFQVQLWLPSGTSLDHTFERVQAIDRRMRSEPGVARVDWLVGSSFPSVYYNLLANVTRAPEYAHGIVTAESATDAGRLVREWQTSLERHWPDVQLVVRELSQGPPIDAPIELRVYGPDLVELRRLAEEVRGRLSRVPRVVHTRMSLGGGQPKLWFHADEDEVRRAGFSLVDVAEQIQGNLEGVEGGSVLEDTESLPVRLRYPATERDELSRLESINLVGGERWVPLAGLGTFTLAPSLEVIPRRQGERVASIFGYVTADALPLEVTAELVTDLEENPLHLPPGYRLERGGEDEEQGEAIGALIAYLPLLLLLMVATVVLSFRSFAVAFILGGVALLTFGLGSLAILWSGFPYGFMAMIGTAGLLGVAVNDSIVVLAALRADAAASRGDVDAVVRETLGCGRHVTATTLTTVGGFLPLILAGGGFWPPLAVVIAGGVTGATLLALVFVPAAHVLTTRMVGVRHVQIPG